MPTSDWTEWCRRAEDLEVEGNGVVVSLADGRKHRVIVIPSATCYELHSVVAGAARLESIPDVELRAWRRNRSMQQVGFGFDAKERLVAEAWIPTVGITREEFLACLRHVAAEADLFEYQLTGADRE